MPARSIVAFSSICLHLRLITFLPLSRWELSSAPAPPLSLFLSDGFAAGREDGIGGRLPSVDSSGRPRCRLGFCPGGDWRHVVIEPSTGACESVWGPLAASQCKWMKLFLEPSGPNSCSKKKKTMHEVSFVVLLACHDDHFRCLYSHESKTYWLAGTTPTPCILFLDRTD